MKFYWIRGSVSSPEVDLCGSIAKCLRWMVLEINS